MSKKRRLDYLCPSDDEDNGAPSKQFPRTTQWRFQPYVMNEPPVEDIALDRNSDVEDLPAIPVQEFVSTHGSDDDSEGVPAVTVQEIDHNEEYDVYHQYQNNGCMPANNPAENDKDPLPLHHSPTRCSSDSDGENTEGSTTESSGNREDTDINEEDSDMISSQLQSENDSSHSSHWSPRGSERDADSESCGNREDADQNNEEDSHNSFHQPDTDNDADSSFNSSAALSENLDNNSHEEDNIGDEERNAHFQGDGIDDNYFPCPPSPQDEAFENLALPPPQNVPGIEDLPGQVLQPDNAFLNLKQMLEGPYSRKITSTPKLTSGELLLNTVNLIDLYKFNHSQSEGIMRLINSIFQSNIVPPSRYCIDKLLKSSAGARFHFLCIKCSHYMGEKNYEVQSIVKCDNCDHDNEISNLNNAFFFVIFDVPTQLEVLFNKPKIFSALKNPKDLLNLDGIMRDVYDGIIYQNFVQSILSLPPEDIFSHISFVCSDDGTPLFSTNNVEVWPIFVMILELPPEIRVQNLILVGIWIGKKKPLQEIFLKPFIKQCNKLYEDGFQLQVGDNGVLQFKAHLLGICCDAPARAAVQCVHLHNGRTGCNWCLHPGESVGPGVRKYYALDPLPELRTAAELLEDGLAVSEITTKNAQVNGVIGLSPLLLSKTLDPVKGLILDKLHHSDHGIGKLFPDAWLGEHGATAKYYIGSPLNLEKMEALISMIKLPVEARRPARKIAEFAEFQAKDHQNFNLFISVPLLLELNLNQFKPFLKHWLLFVQGSHLLMQREVSQENLNLANMLLCKFASSLEEVYGEEAGKCLSTYNVHITFHTGENAAHWGNDWAVNAYAFEAGNKTLKSDIASGRGIASQIIRGISKSCALNVLENICGSSVTDKFREDLKKETVVRCVTVNADRYLGVQRSFQPTAGEVWWCNKMGIDFTDFIQVDKLIHLKCVYAPFKKQLRTNNSISYLKDKSYVLIDKIIVSEVIFEGFLIVRKVHTSPAVSVQGVPNDLIAWRRVDLIEDRCLFIKPMDLDIVCARMKFPNGDYIIKVPNIHNTC